jgi:hypothetical protein
MCGGRWRWCCSSLAKISSTSSFTSTESCCSCCLRGRSRLCRVRTGPAAGGARRQSTDALNKEIPAEAARLGKRQGGETSRTPASSSARSTSRSAVPARVRRRRRTCTAAASRRSSVATPPTTTSSFSSLSKMVVAGHICQLGGAFCQLDGVTGLLTPTPPLPAPGLCRRRRRRRPEHPWAATSHEPCAVAGWREVPSVAR